MAENPFDVSETLESALRHLEKKNVTPPPPPPPPPVVKGLWYKAKVIKLDGWIFESCRFDNCRLVVSSPYFILRDCFIDDSNEIEYEGAAINIVKLFNFNKQEYPPSAFHPERNYDGTITIGG